MKAKSWQCSHALPEANRRSAELEGTGQPHQRREAERERLAGSCSDLEVPSRPARKRAVDLAEMIETKIRSGFRRLERDQIPGFEPVCHAVHVATGVEPEFWVKNCPCIPPLRGEGSQAGRTSN